LSPIIASASFDKTIKLWNLYTGECVGTLEGHTDFVTCVRAVGDRTLVSSSNDKTIKVRSSSTSLLPLGVFVC
jgi:WD40 repeat protein